MDLRAQKKMKTASRTHRMKNSDAFALSGKNERNIEKIENVKERQ